MKRNDKAAAKLCLVLLAVGVITTYLYLSGWGAIAKNVVVLGWRGNTMTSLARRTPFTPPTGAGVSEERLKAYLAVCTRIKPFGDRIDEWEEARTAGSRFAFKGEAAGFVERYLVELNDALEQHRMGPAEFAWIEDRMRRAATGSASGEVPESDRALHGTYRDRLVASALGAHAREIALGFAR
jgi:hypothetical protein